MPIFRNLLVVVHDGELVVIQIKGGRQRGPSKETIYLMTSLIVSSTSPVIGLVYCNDAFELKGFISNNRKERKKRSLKLAKDCGILTRT